MALMVNGKKVLGFALGDNEYLNGETLNAFYIDRTGSGYGSNANPYPITIDMTNYFKEADTKHPDVQYYQIITFLSYQDNDRNSFVATLITPLLKRGEINNKRSVAASDDQAITAWFKDKNTLVINPRSTYDHGLYAFMEWDVYVYGFTSQDVGSVS